MLSLLRWGLGSGSEHPSDKESMATATLVARAPGALPMMEMPRAPKRKRADGVVAKPDKRRTSNHVRPELKAGDALRVVNSPGAALLAQQQAEREAALNIVTAPIAAVPSQSSLQFPENTGLIDLTMPAVAPSVPAVTRDKLQETIATEFGLEILLKHKELRLIDQELAKCQVALEQLRRCQTIPYPSQSVDSTARLNVSGGIGRPVRSHHARQATHPPPWGVVDGPYSRHYAQWLLPDPAFDGGVSDEYLMTARPGKMLPDRHTRGSKGEQFLLATKRMRGAPTSRLQSLPAGYPEAKEHKGPMILKRAADDKLVKLVCLDCKREDFNSAQGFINHCRIAHSRGFASHEAAAQACGQEIEANEVAPPPTNTPAEPSTGVMTPAGALVHPLVKSNPTVPTLSMPVPRSQRAAAPPKNPKKLSVNTAPQPGFTPAASAPHLSKLFALAGRATNLSAMVTEATAPVGPNESEDESSADAGSDFDAGEASDASTAVPMARMPSRGGLRAGPVKSTAPQEGQKGVGRPSRRAAALQAEAHNAAVTSEELEVPHASSELSPHAVESNNAPSLVSDDDDYAESQSSTSPSSHSSDAEDEEHMDVEVEEVPEVPRLRGGGHHLDTPRVEVPPALPSKSEDPELRASGNAKVAPRRAPRPHASQPSETAAPKKRGRPRKAQP